MKHLIYIAVILHLIGCFRPDEYLPKIDDEKVNVLLKHNEKSSYIRLDYPIELHVKEDTIWQLKFENSPQKWSVYTNPNYPIQIHNTKSNKYQLIDSTYLNNSIDWNFDVVKPNYIESAIGSWGDFSFPNPESFKEVYILSWIENNVQVHYKMQILDADKNAYILNFGRLNDTSTQIKVIEKDETHLHSYLSLSNNQLIKGVEPKGDQWHFQLRYQADSISKHKNLPYISSPSINIGLYPSIEFNYKNTEVFIDTISNFEEISYIYAKNLPYELYHNQLGLFFEWDAVNQITKTNDRQLLIIRSNDEYYALKALQLENDQISDIKIMLKTKKL